MSIRITFCSWGPIIRQTYSYGIPPGLGARTAVRRFPVALARLAGG